MFFSTGIYDLYIDVPQQKLTIIGWADPEKIIKAIKKTRKIATICSHTEQQTEPPPPTEPAPQGNEQQQQQQPPQDAAAANPPAAEAPPPEPAPPAEPPKDPPPPENPPSQPEPQPSPVATDTNNEGHPAQPSSSTGPKDVGEVHVIYHHPPDYGYRYGYGYGHGHGHGYNGYWNKYHNSQGHPPQEVPAPPVYVTHSYNTYKPSPYVTEYEYIRSPPSQTYYHNRVERYNEEPNQYYYNVNNGNNGNITSIFSDENPNACRIM